MPTMSEQRQGLNELSRDECMELLSTVPVGRMGCTIDFRPMIFPVNFALFEGSILIRSVPGTKFDKAVSGVVTAFEADGYSEDGAAGWSVMVHGIAQEITDPEEVSRAEAVDLPTYALPNAPKRLLKLSTTNVTGRQFGYSADEN